MDNTIKPVILDPDKCNGCVACLKRCPTEAIRVYGGKSTIDYQRCIGCGACVKICPTKARKELYDSFEEIKKYEYTICLPSPSLYGQYNNLTNINYVLQGLINLGFSSVYEVAAGAELVSAATKKYLKTENAVKPLIGSACSAVTKLILTRYGHLAPHLSPMKQPETVAAKRAVIEAMQKTGLKREQIGVFVITQCAAKATVLRTPSASKYIDKVLSSKEIYFSLLSEMNKLAGTDAPQLACTGKLGVSWGSTAGEAIGLGTDNYLCADGMENVIEVLNELEHDKLNGLDFLGLYACPSGCVGGSMSIENPFLARMRLRKLRNATKEHTVEVDDPSEFMRSEPYVAGNMYKLSENRAEALLLTMRVKEIFEQLPGLNCGACGAPSCHALAEDRAKGEPVECKNTFKDARKAQQLKAE